MASETRAGTLLSGRLEVSASWLSVLLLASVILSGLALAYLCLLGTPALVDEVLHVQRIQYLCQGKLHPTPPSTLPGYHLLMTAMAWLYGGHSLPELRLCAVILSGLALAVFFLAATAIGQRHRGLRTLQLFALPILFPYLFLVYTDACALLFVLASFLFMTQKRCTAAGIAGMLSVCVRQQNIVWLACFGLMSYVDEHGWKWQGAALRRHLRRHWSLLLTASVFAAFVILNGGVAVGDRKAHSIAFDPNNVFFSLGLFCLVFLPWHLANWGKVVSLLTDRRVQIGLGILFMIYMVSFGIRHPYNDSKPVYFLRNALLHATDAKLSLRALFFVPLAFGLLSLLSSRMTGPSHVLLFAFCLLVLLPQELVESRYYIVPFSLFLLLAESKPRWLEWAALCHFTAFSAFIFWGAATQQFFW